MKKTFGLLLALLLTLTAHATGIGEWNIYLAYHDATYSQPAGNVVFANFDGNLLSYSPVDEEVKLFSKIDGLKGNNIKFLGYSETEECLVIVYNDFLIDLLYPKDGTVVSLPQIKNADTEGLKVNSLFVEGNNAIIAMSDGLIHINVAQQEITGYYKLNKDVRAAALHDDMLYAATSNMLFTCAATGNPLDVQEWKALKASAFHKFVTCGPHLYGQTDQAIPNNGLTAGLWLFDGDAFQKVSSTVYPNLFSQKGKLLVANGQEILMFDEKNPTVPETKIQFVNSWKSVSRSSDGTLWASNGEGGLQAYKISNNTLKPQGDAIGKYGPRRDLCYYMRYEGDRLLIAGGRLDPYGIQHNPGTIIVNENNNWSSFQEKEIVEQTSYRYWDVTSIAQDPKDPDHHFASTAWTGIYEFRKGVFVKHYSAHNTPIESAVDNNFNYVRTDGLNFDAKGNLWMVNNSQKDTVLRVRRPDGTWKGFYFEPIKQAPTLEKTLIDKKGRLWVASRRSTNNPEHDAGLFCLDYNGTIDNTKDDIAKYRSTFVNQDGKSYVLKGVFSMAEDHDGSLWVGTRVGLFWVNNPDNWNAADFYVTQVKVPRNDGTNFADYLLDGLPISAIAIDGAGRKWIGSETNGLYLVSKEGTKVLEHFTAENSPLLSNNIYSLAPNPKTGEIMIGTDKGLCAYQSAATTPESSLNENNIKVYPNPVRPEYHGSVHVDGLTYDAEVKVVSTSGKVVAGGRSTGGTFVWDVRGLDGGRVAPGVYYFMIATADGNKGVAAKVVVI